MSNQHQTEVFTTSEGVVVAENKDGIYDPYCLIQDEELCVPSLGGEWIPAVRIDEGA